MQGVRTWEAIYAWLEERLGLQGVVEFAKRKSVPMHRHSIWYYFGGMTLFLFAVQVVTGILLMLYYRPSADEAFESVQFIMTQVPFGWLVRSIHGWSANLMIAAAFVHLFSVLFLKAYRRPRELTWSSGFVLLLLSLGFGFSGYLLPWNKLAFFATQVGTELVGSLPLVGDWIMRFLRGGDHVTGGTLSRFYGWHVALLPALATFVLALHLWLVQRHGMSVPPSVERAEPPEEIPFFPDFLLRDLFGWTLALGILAALAAFLPWELGEKADPFAPAYADIRPEWYFMFLFVTLRLVPGGQTLGVEHEAWVLLGSGVLVALGFLLPLLDRSVVRQGRSPWVTFVAAVLLVYIVATTAYGYRAWWPVIAGGGAVAIPWAWSAIVWRRRAAP